MLFIAGGYLCELTIPDRVQGDFEKDHFDEFFSRVIADIDYDGLCGQYEKDIAEDLKRAFNESKLVKEN